MRYDRMRTLGRGRAPEGIGGEQPAPSPAVAAIAVSRTTIIAPPAGLWPMKRRSDPPAIVLR